LSFYADNSKLSSIIFRIFKDW